MERKYKIFVSSTKRDLMNERSAVFEEILKLGHIPVGMEHFLSGRPSIDIIKEDIIHCDIYVLIVGRKYGSIYKDKKSYTHFEYEFAKSINKPLFAIVANKKWYWKIKPMQKNFRALICSNQCEFFSNIVELKLALSTSLSKMVQNNRSKLNGYVNYIDLSKYRNLKYFVFEHDAKIYRFVADITKNLIENQEVGIKSILTTNICELIQENLFCRNVSADCIDANKFVEEVLSEVFSEIMTDISTINEIQKTFTKNLTNNAEKFVNISTDNLDLYKSIEPVAERLIYNLFRLKDRYTRLNYDVNMLNERIGE